MDRGRLRRAVGGARAGEVKRGRQGVTRIRKKLKDNYATSNEIRKAENET